MSIMCTSENRTLIVKIIGEIDHCSSNEIKNKTDKEYKRLNSKNIIFDLSGVTFMDSSGIGVLIGRCKKMGYGGGEVVAEHLSERIQKIFVVSGLHKMIRVAPQTMDDGRN